jgi:hypothetical protein
MALPPLPTVTEKVAMKSDTSASRERTDQNSKIESPAKAEHDDVSERESSICNGITVILLWYR